MITPRPVESNVDRDLRLALAEEWPDPNTRMPLLEANDPVVNVRRTRWVQCDTYGRSFRLETCADPVGGVVRVRPGYAPRRLPSCDSVIYNNRAYGGRLQPCEGRARTGHTNYGAPVVVRVPQQGYSGPPPVVILER